MKVMKSREILDLPLNLNRDFRKLPRFLFNHLRDPVIDAARSNTVELRINSDFFLTSKTRFEVESKSRHK